jgi:SAM-dependent methyltransferase
MDQQPDPDDDAGEAPVPAPPPVPDPVAALLASNAANLLGIIEANSSNILALLDQNLASLSARLTDLEDRLLRQSVVQRRFFPLAPGRAVRRSAIRPRPLSESLEALRAAAPRNFEAYRQCLEAGTASYAGLPAESCSTERHPEAQLFRAFIRPYLRGRVLDVGCGPQPVPIYLADFPPSRIVGVDPIAPEDGHPFRFVHGFGEFLPLGDGAMSVVISATTLDHYYLLDRGLREAFRVLAPGGHFLAWITEFAGAPRYDPYGGVVTPYDREHMFHIDRAWFLPMMRDLGFVEQEVLHFRRPFNFLFMSFARP